VILSEDSRSSEKFMHGIRVLMVKNYVDNLSEEVRKGMRGKAEQGRLAKSEVHRILRNPIYAGEFVWKGMRYKGQHQPLISASLQPPSVQPSRHREVPAV
jgi:hypothetical protein